MTLINEEMLENLRFHDPFVLQFALKYGRHF